MSVQKFFFSGLFVLLTWSSPTIYGFNLRILKVIVADEPSAGMDGGGIFSYGEFRMKVCSSVDVKPSCCQTEQKLNTKDNNWQIGEINYFVGKQLQECENFQLPDTDDDSVNVTLIHRGSDGCKLESVMLSGGKTQALPSWSCTIGVKLDHDESFEAQCSFAAVNTRNTTVCNGRPEFCDIPFNKFIFPGTHNSGTGEGPNGLLPSMYKNHDLTLTEQLDFGVRFFDFDVIKSKTTPGCNGLMTGHGFSIKFYQCYRRVSEFLKEMKAWLDEHTSEVIVMHFGDFKSDVSSASVVSNLKSVLRNTFNGRMGVKMNSMWQKKNVWPTLGQSVKSNERVFVMIEHENVDPVEDQEFIKAIKLQEDDENANVTLQPGSVTVLSTYKSGSIGSDCTNVAENNERICQNNNLKPDFTKLAAFGSLSLSYWSLHKIARLCNSRVAKTLDQCLSHRQVNFIQSDYPNYPGKMKLTVAEIAEKANLRQSGDLHLEN